MVGRLVVGGILTAIAALASLPQMITIPLFVLAYLLIGGDIVWRAVRNITRGQVFDENFLMAIATLGAFRDSTIPRSGCSNVILSSRGTIPKYCGKPFSKINYFINGYSS